MDISVILFSTQVWRHEVLSKYQFESWPTFYYLQFKSNFADNVKCLFITKNLNSI
jgi:hypothetical protein